MAKKRDRLTTGFGMPVDDDQNSVTAGPQGPILAQDVHLIEKLAHSTANASRSAWFTPRERARADFSRSRATWISSRRAISTAA